MNCSKKIQEANKVADDVITIPSFSQKERTELVADKISEIAQFCDDNAFFINYDLGAHCTALLMGVEDIYAYRENSVKEIATKEYREQYVNAIRMIEEDSGVSQVKRLIKSISKPKIYSSLIARLDELREEKRKKSRTKR